MALVQHSKTPLNEGEWSRDGDLDAMETVYRVDEADVPYTFRHRLKRVVRQVSIVWADDYIQCAVVRDASGNPISDAEQIVLKFSEANTLIRLRFS